MARKANPIAAPATTIQPRAECDERAVRPVVDSRPWPASIARTTAYAPRVIKKTNRASGSLNRTIKAATGVSMTTAPAIRPAASPSQRRTVAQVNATVPTPSSACGSSIENEETEQPRGQHHQPQRTGGLVDGDRVAWFERAEDPGRHRLRPGLDRRGVEGVGVTGVRQVAQIQHRGRDQQHAQTDDRPAA
ncbi:MAG TPA: hypothetical protein VIT65_26200 [Microlunatus sp.]